MFNVHVKDHIADDSVELGMGVTNNRGCVIALRDAGYDGCLTQEIEVSRELSDVAAADGLRFMKTLARQKREEILDAMRVVNAVIEKPNGYSRLQ